MYKVMLMQLLVALCAYKTFLNKLHHLTERDSRLAHFSACEILRLSRLVIKIPTLGCLGVLGFLGYLGTSGAKYDNIFLLSDPDFL